MTGTPSSCMLGELRRIGERKEVQGWVSGNRDSVRSWMSSTAGGVRIAARPSDAEVVEQFKNELRKARRGGRVLDPPTHIDEAKVERSCELFARYGTEIGAALLLAALPEAYAASFGAWVLYGVSRLAEGSGDLTRRVALTAQFLVNVMTARVSMIPIGSGDRQPTPAHQIAEALWAEKDGFAADQALKLRLLHDFMRDSGNAQRGHLERSYPDPDPTACFLNQEDLLGTLLTFSVTVFEVLEKFGITWTADDQEAYLHMWDLVGHCLGIGDHNVLRELGNRQAEWTDADRRFLEEAGRRGNIRPQTVPDARETLARIRRRVWGETAPGEMVPPFAEFDETLQPGRILVRALLDDIHRAMPVTRPLWPIRAMRQLVPPLVCDRLALGATPPSDFLFSTLPRGVAVVGRFTHVSRPNRLGGRMLRMLSTDVSSRYFTLLIEEGLVIRGIPIGKRLPTGAPTPPPSVAVGRRVNSLNPRRANGAKV